LYSWLLAAFSQVEKEAVQTKLRELEASIVRIKEGMYAEAARKRCAPGVVLKLSMFM
jgi:hypothetical protein